ncbi:GDSL esterase/lipase At4g16230 isoform X1 [Physcomitrium patens]|nr:GDSL esterase/lipase At4g16230-like [Physcomitrium patens]XP_024368985.1 GDSL esterase/lipase At4g16230-like [Physcomitrium patens]XP_024368986.1 GDSL esterase/lipase At4g16230-like [Physcomitrium patens]PNR59334.1 hypothetical protein PHYPA_002125 [Physcomitrium patens]|eukprot:XP_024368984.1 GDSL esterase/lipase At4g16230-like [Physcomitrella patens]
MEFLRCSSASVVPFIWILLLIPSIASAQRPPALFVFGDSLSDPGNNNFIRTLSKADSPPNGIDFPGGFATGRYCNGRTTVDILGQKAGKQGFLVPYLAPNASGPLILQGVNYASGAGGILDSSGYVLYGRIPMNKQLEYFANTKAQIIAQLGEQAGNELISSALYSSNLGSNDYLNNYYQPLSPVGNLTSTQLATLLINTYRGQLTKLYNLGARKVVVPALGPLGCIPFQLSFRLSKNGECSEKVNAEVREFNAGVFGLVKELNANLPGAKFIYLDSYKIVSEMIANPRAYGFTVANVGCCGAGGNYKGVVPCLPNFNICPNRFDYLFWDPYHPTDKANVIIADRFWSSTEYSYPMNIQQLLMS